METTKIRGFGFRGSMLIIYQFFAFGVYCVINQIGQNMYPMLNNSEWNGTLISVVYTIASVVAIVLQFIFGQKIANSGKLKITSIILLLLAAVFTIGIATIRSSEFLWLLCWGLAIFTSVVGATFVVSTIVGQWFPRRKGTVMGIATLAFPVINGIALTIFTRLLAKGQLFAWLPWLIMDAVAILICIIFIKEYPEQCGAYPDNDRSITPEQARAMLAGQLEAKKNSVWKVGKLLKTGGFWLIVIPIGLLLLGAIGTMTQVMPILGTYGDRFVVGGNGAYMPTAQGTVTLLVFAGLGCVGSYILGLIDTKWGTKTALIISSILMLLSGILCVFRILPMFLIGFTFLQFFLGASSNFTVSAGAQYWRREDFPSAFSMINPVANMISAFGPFLVAGLSAAMGGSFTWVWIAISVLGLVALICSLIFKPKMLIDADKKYRREAGLPEEGLTKSAAELMGEK